MTGNIFTANIGLKLASLGFAMALWFFVILSGRTEITLEVPINFVNLSDKLEIVDSPLNVSVRIKGQKRIIMDLKQKEISATVDLSNVKEGRSFFTLSRDNFQLPKTFVITNIDPETISLKIEMQMRKTVPVKPYVVGLPEKGFVITEINVEPEQVLVEGPKSVITKIMTVKTEPIDISGINNNLKYKANLNLSDSNTRKSINKVEVNISVKKIE